MLSKSKIPTTSHSGRLLPTGPNADTYALLTGQNTALADMKSLTALRLLQPHILAAGDKHLPASPDTLKHKALAAGKLNSLSTSSRKQQHGPPPRVGGNISRQADWRRGRGARLPLRGKGLCRYPVPPPPGRPYGGSTFLFIKPNKVIIRMS